MTAVADSCQTTTGGDRGCYRIARRNARISDATNSLLSCSSPRSAHQVSARAQSKTLSPDAALAHARELLSTTPLIDGHNDLPWAIRENTAAPRDVEAYDLRKHTPHQTDIARMRSGKLGGQFWSVYVPGEVRDSGYARIQLEQIDIARRHDREVSRGAGRRLHGRGRARGVRGREGRLAPRHGRRPRDRELARRAARLLRPRRALHDAHAQRDARLGRRRARQREARRAHELRARGGPRDEPARDARGSRARVAGRDEQRARRDRGAGDLLAFRGARARRSSAQRARLDPAPAAEERRRGDGAVRPRLRLAEGARALGRARTSCARCEARAAIPRPSRAS